MHVRDYSLLGGAVLAALRSRGQAALAPWMADWGVAPQLQCERAGAAGPDDGTLLRQCWADGARRLWLAWPASMTQALQHAMFPADSGAGARTAGAPLAAQGAAEALDALLASLVQGLLAPAQRTLAGVLPDPSQFAPGAGCAVLRLTVGASSLSCLLNPALVAALVPAPPAPAGALPAVDYAAALAATALALAVRVGQAELGLGALMSVAVGDVIRLDAAVDAPVTVLGPAGAPLFHAYLGQSGGAIAVDLDSRY